MRVQSKTLTTAIQGRALFMMTPAGGEEGKVNLGAAARSGHEAEPAVTRRTLSTGPASSPASGQTPSIVRRTDRTTPSGNRGRESGRSAGDTGRSVRSRIPPRGRSGGGFRAAIRGPSDPEGWDSRVKRS